MKEFVELRAKIYTCEDEKAKSTKKVSQEKIRFKNYKNCLEATQLDNRMNYLEKK